MSIERWVYTIPLRLESIFRGRQVEREMDEELRFHLEYKIDEGIANGLSPQEARLAALRATDGLEQRKEEIRDARGIHWLTDFRRRDTLRDPQPAPNVRTQDPVLPSP